MSSVIEKRVNETKTRLSQIMTPNDANVLGKVFGGSILAMLDLTASATAQKYSGHISVTAAFERVDFHTPIEVGDLVEMEGVVTYVGRTSMEITIEVRATNLTAGTTVHSNTARVVMVAVADGQPVAVPKLICETREEKAAFLAGRLRREIRAQRLAEFESWMVQLNGLGEAELDSLLASEGSLRETLARRA